MTRIKNTPYFNSFRDNQFFIDILRRLFYGIPCRFVLRFSFLILPFLSYGQLFKVDANTVPVVGLENVYMDQQQKVKPTLFVTCNTIISKAAETTFFVEGLTQVDTLFVTQIYATTIPTSLPVETKYKIKIGKKNEPEVATTEVRKNTYHPALPAFPWNKNPLQHEIFCASVVVVSVLSKPEFKKNDNRQFQLCQLCPDLLQIDAETRCYSVYFTFSSTTTFGKNSTEFSSRPPPVAKYM